MADTFSHDQYAQQPTTSCGGEEIGDIEDAVGSEDAAPSDRVKKDKIFPKRFKAARADDSTAEKSSEVVKGNIDGTETIYIKTWGCSHNNSDGEYMAGLLASFGYTVTTSDSDAADLWVLNSCTVKTPSEDNFNNMIREAQSRGKHVVVAGCVPQAQPNGKMMDGLSIVGVQQIDRVVEVVEETLKGNRVRLLGPKKDGSKRLGGAALNLPKIRKNPLIEILAINTGCLNQCTYCKTKHARGDLASYPVDELCDRVSSVIKEGVVEFWLTSEDTGTYGRDINSSLPELLWKIVELLPEGTMLRLGMTNPPYILEHIEEIARIMQHPRVYAFLHIPIQAASDAVLTTMRREYTCADFCRVVDVLREKVPGVTIATDIICGFPGETQQDFEETVALINKYQFPVLFINQFFARPGTPAALMPKVPTTEVKERTKILSEIFRSYFPYENRVGQVYRALITEEASDRNHFVAHNKFYEQILVEKRDELMGKMVDVKIVRTGKFFMEGEIIYESLAQAPKQVAPQKKGAIATSGVPLENIRHREPSKVQPVVQTERWASTTRLLVIGLVLVVVFDLLRFLLRWWAAAKQSSTEAL